MIYHLTKQLKTLQAARCVFIFVYHSFDFHAALVKAAGSLPKPIRKNPTKRIHKNLKNINWYTYDKSSEAGNCCASLVSLIIPLSWPE